MNVRFAMVLAAALPAAAFAQTGTDVAPAPREHRTVPELNGHVFAPSAIVETPFRMTTFKLGLLYGVGGATGPKYDINGDVKGTADYTFGTLAQTFRYEYQFTEWLSAGVLVLTSMYTGLDGPSAVSVGAQFGAGAGLRVKIGHRFGPVDAGFSIDGSSTPQYGLLVAAALVKAVKDRVIDPGTALQATHTLAFNPAFTVSWAPAAAFGITGSVGYLFNSLRVSGQSVSNSDQSSIQISAVADFDFGKVSSVPIAVLGGYRHNAPVGDNGIPAIDDITGGIFYSGIRELALGVEGGWRAFTLRPGTTVSLDSHVTVAQLSLQYYW